MAQIRTGRHPLCGAVAWAVCAFVCAQAATVTGQEFFSPYTPSGDASPTAADSGPIRPPAASGGVYTPAPTGDWPAPPPSPYTSPPPRGAGTQSVLVSSTGAADRQSIRLAERQEEIPAPGSATPVPTPSLDEEISLFELEGCEDCRSCNPGQLHQCTPNCARTRLGRFLHALYLETCCPDPCYDPQWWALADAAFYTAAARPVSQQRFRWDAGYDMVFPDRAEYFWARSGGGGAGPSAIVPSLRFHQLSMYTEVAHGAFGAFTEIPYRSLYTTLGGHDAGFSDINFGVKSLLHDTELAQLTFQMRTFTPVGQSTKGLGTGHFSLEPSLILGLNLSPFSYFQGQVAEWIPLGGDPDYAGALLHYHFAYNRSLLGEPAGVHWIGVMEFNGWSFQDGAYSAYPATTLLPASNHTYLSGGPGLRIVICDQIDFGVGTAFAYTRDQWAEQQYRSELRLRF
jgi:hypothetical protein